MKPNVIPMICSISLALLFHALWLSLRLSTPEPQSFNPPPVVSAFFRELPGSWSPTLFSLPSPTGFSGAMKKNNLHTAPPLESPLDLTGSVRLSMPDLSLSQELNRSFAPEESRLKTLGFSIQPSQPDRVPEWSFVFLDDPEIESRLSRLPQEVPERIPFELNGEMTFDESGRLLSMIMEPTSFQDPVAGEAIRILRRIQAPEAPAERRMRFRFSYLPGGNQK